MEQIAKIERASLLTRIFFRIGERMFGLVRQVHREESGYCFTKYRIEKRGDMPVKLTIEGTHDASGQEPLENELANFPATSLPAK
ncbi:MAG: hypothetical protein WAN81_17125 [Candidatus Binataceae bacterium]